MNDTLLRVAQIISGDEEVNEKHIHDAQSSIEALLPLDDTALTAAYRWFATGPSEIPIIDMIEGVVSSYLKALK